MTLPSISISSSVFPWMLLREPFSMASNSLDIMARWVVASGSVQYSRWTWIWWPRKLATWSNSWFLRLKKVATWPEELNVWSPTFTGIKPQTVLSSVGSQTMRSGKQEQVFCQDTTVTPCLAKVTLQPSGLFCPLFQHDNKCWQRQSSNPVSPNVMSLCRGLVSLSKKPFIVIFETSPPLLLLKRIIFAMVAMHSSLYDFGELWSSKSFNACSVIFSRCLWRRWTSSVKGRVEGLLNCRSFNVVNAVWEMSSDSVECFGTLGWLYQRSVLCHECSAM